MKMLAACLPPLAGPAFILLLSPLAQAATHDFQSPGNYSFTVPAGVTSLQFEVAGAGGGAGSGGTVPPGFGTPDSLVGAYPGGSGGSGARVTGTLAVTPGDVISMVVADSGKGGTAHTVDAPTSSGAGGAGSGSGGATTNAIQPTDEGRSLSGGGGGGASALSVAGTHIRAGGGGGGAGMFRSQVTFSRGEAGAPGVSPAASTATCGTPANGQPGTGSAIVLANDGAPGHSYYRTGSGGGGGGGYGTQGGAGGITPGMVFGGPQPVVEFAPTGGGGGGSCTWVSGTRTLTSVSSDSLGGEGGIADLAPMSVWELSMPDTTLPAPIHGKAGWIRLTVPDAAPAAPTPVPGLQPWGIAALTGILLLGCALGGRRRG